MPLEWRRKLIGSFACIRTAKLTVRCRSASAVAAVVVLLARPRAPQDDPCSSEADSRPDKVPPVWLHTFGEPKPHQSRCYVNTSISSIGATGLLSIDEGQQVSEQAERQGAWYEPPRRLVEPQPGPEGEAARDLRQRGSDVGDDRHSKLVAPVIRVCNGSPRSAWPVRLRIIIRGVPCWQLPRVPLLAAYDLRQN